MRQKDLTSGILLIVVGLIFLGANVGIAPKVNVRDLWPVILLVIGVGRLVAPGDKRDSRWSGTSLILIAGIFLAQNYRVLELRDSWPLFIVVAGLSILFNRRDRQTPRKQS